MPKLRRFGMSAFRPSYEGWKLDSAVQHVVVNMLLDLPMRDGNVKMPKRWSNLLRFRPSYEGWKRENAETVGNLLLLLDLPMRDGNTDSSQEAHECPALTFL